MEVAIPLVALGGMYVISNQKTKNNENMKEGYESMGKDPNYLPNTSVPVQNYPVVNKKELTETLHDYPNANVATDRYFNQDMYEKIADKNQVGNQIQQVSSLTGNSVDVKDFKHNNMVPFFGSRVRGIVADLNNTESILDNTQGAGSQLIRKKEQAPLFKPEKNVQWGHGTPNMSDFMQSRVNPSMKMANVKPWKEQQVGPGLAQGYNTEGCGGFNAGMVARDQWLPKSVNELRTETNPKITYGLFNHEGPVSAPVKNRGIEGKVEKHGPDGFFIQGPDRYLTTTGIEKAQTARAIEVDKPVNRPSTNMEYYGSGDSAGLEASYAPSQYRQSHRHQLEGPPMSHMNASKESFPSKGDYGRDSYNILQNNRTTTNEPEKLGIVGGALKAAVAPLLDVLRPSKKENVIGNLRPTGDAGTTVPAQPVYNPADRTRTTIREMTENSPFHINLQRQIEGGYQVSAQQPVQNQRDSTNCSSLGYAGNTAETSNARVYNDAYNMRTNPNREDVSRSRANQGGTQMFNQNDNIHIDKRDADRNNNRMWAPQTAINMGSSIDTYGRVNVPQYNNQCVGCDRINPDLLEAFKKNPYTQSLQSVA